MKKIEQLIGNKHRIEAITIVHNYISKMSNGSCSKCIAYDKEQMKCKRVIEGTVYKPCTDMIFDLLMREET